LDIGRGRVACDPERAGVFTFNRDIYAAAGGRDGGKRRRRARHLAAVSRDRAGPGKRGGLRNERRGKSRAADTART